MFQGIWEKTLFTSESSYQGGFKEPSSAGRLYSGPEINAYAPVHACVPACVLGSGVVQRLCHGLGPGSQSLLSRDWTCTTLWLLRQGQPTRPEWEDQAPVPGVGPGLERGGWGQRGPEPGGQGGGSAGLRGGWWGRQPSGRTPSPRWSHLGLWVISCRSSLGPPCQRQPLILIVKIFNFTVKRKQQVQVESTDTVSKRSLPSKFTALSMLVESTDSSKEGALSRSSPHSLG